MWDPKKNPTRDDYDPDKHTYDEETDTLYHTGDDGYDYHGNGDKIET